MEPIAINLHKNPKLIQNEKELIDDTWENSEFYNFMPEFLEECYKGGNAPKLKEANEYLKYYCLHKSDYTYIASWRHIERYETLYVEYYYMDDNTIIAYLIVVPSEKRYYPNLTTVQIFKKKEEEIN